MKDFLKSFSFRFFISFFILAFFSFFAGGYFFLKVMQGYFEEELNEKLVSIGKVLSSNLDLYFEKNLEGEKYLKYLREKLLKNRNELNLKRLYIFNIEGESIVDTEDLPSKTLLGIFKIYPSAIENLKKGNTYKTLLYEVNGEYFKSAFVPLNIKGGSNFGLGIEISAEYVKSFKNLQFKILIFFFIIILFSLVISYYLSKAISNPLKKLIKETDSLIKSDFEKKVNFHSGTELDKLGSTLELLRKKINQRDQYLKRMVSQIAHEIKNPLSIYNFYLSFLNEEKISDQEKSKYLNILKEETLKIEELLDSFINFVRKGEPKFEYIKLKEVFLQIERFYLKKAEEQKIEIVLEVGEDLKVYTDKDFLFHIIFNLIKNSFEAMENGGKLILSGKELEDFYEIIVKDEGCGINKEILSNVFEPFFTTKPKGIGLGLTIVEEYTKKLKGKLMLNSEESVGTEVFIYLPKEV